MPEHLTLKQARVLKDMTQIEASEALGVSEDTLSKWERAKTFPNVKQIKKIEELYGIPYEGIDFLCNKSSV